MSIWQRAVETYDCHSDSVGKSFDNHVTLMPISHIIQNAQIEILLDEYGKFKEALRLLFRQPNALPDALATLHARIL